MEIEILNKNKYKVEVVIKKECYKKIKYITEIASEEIGTLLECYKEKTILKDNTIYIKYIVNDTFILEQEVNGATCEISQKAIAIFLGKLKKEKRNTILGWWHSHVNMATSPSSQDNLMLEQLTENNETFFIRLIGNKKGEINSCIIDNQEELKFTNVNIQVENEYDKLKEQLEKEIKEKVTKKVYQPTIYETHKDKDKKNKKEDKWDYYEDYADIYSKCGCYGGKKQ